MSANIDSLLASITSQIKNNGNQEITGLVLQSVLKDISNTLNNYAVGQKKGAGEVFNDVNGNVASGTNCHAEGESCKASGKNSHAEGYYTKASGERAHAEGTECVASGNYGTHAEGYVCEASGDYGCHGEGFHTIANGAYGSHAEGFYSQALGDSQHAEGKYNKPYTNPDGIAFIIGNGTSESARGNAFTIGWDGNVRADGTYESPAADYAEFFEWADGNMDAEDRVGYIVAMEGEKIKKANAGDFLVGIISARPAIIGDSPMDWHGKYLNDEWGRPIFEDVEVTEELPDGEVITRTDHRRKLNPEWDNTREYIDRKDRKEWDAVGMFGKLIVRQDGSLKQGGFCAPSNGIATDSKKGWYVMKVINESQALVLVK